MLETINVDTNETDTFQVGSLLEVEYATSESWMATTSTKPGLTSNATSAFLTLTTSAFETADSTTFTTTALTTTTTEPKLLLDDCSFHLSNDLSNDLDDELRESFPNAGNHSISRLQLEHIRNITGRNISGLGKDAMCSSAAYCELSKQNSDYPELSFSVWLIVFSALLK